MDWILGVQMTEKGSIIETKLISTADETSQLQRFDEL
jgi:hypothetical protein